jgi:hypothetical protein
MIMCHQDCAAAEMADGLLIENNLEESAQA